VLRDDHALTLEFEVNAFDGDDADFGVDGKLSNRGKLEARFPVSDSNFLFDVLHDLEVHWATIGLRDDEFTVHTQYMGMHSFEMVSTQALETTIKLEPNMKASLKFFSSSSRTYILKFSQSCL
jgi:hypothetical protein